MIWAEARAQSIPIVLWEANLISMLCLTPLLLAFQSSPPAAAGPLFQWTESVQAPAAQVGDQFGRSLAAGGDRAVVSAWRRDSTTGGAEVYRWSGDQLIHEATLQPSDASQGSMCGLSCHINSAGNMIALGATGDDTLGSNAGAVYVFRRHFGTWIEEAKLLAPNGATSDAFGSSVAAGENTIVVGATGVDIVPPGFYAAGAVYVFEFDTSTWSWDQGQALLAPDPDGGDRFGQCVQVDGGTLAVGCPQKDHSQGDNAGSVYVYSRSAGAWTLEQRIVPADASAGSSFGRDIALDGSLLVASSVVSSMSGQLHAFRRGPLGWSEMARWTAPNPEPFDFFGETVALERGRVLASSRRLDGVDVPAVHAWVLGAGGPDWAQLMTQPLPAGSHVAAASDLALGDEFLLIGEALHAQSIGSVPGRFDAFRPVTSMTRSGPVRETRR